MINTAKYKQLRQDWVASTRPQRAPHPFELLLDELLSTFHCNGLLYLDKANVLSSREDEAGAAAFFQKADDLLAPSVCVNKRKKASSLNEDGNDHEAFNELQAFVEDTDPISLLGFYEELSAAGVSVEEIAQLGALAQEAYVHRALCLMGQLQMKRGRFNDAIDLFKRIPADSTFYFEAQVKLSVCFIQTGDRASAQNTFRALPQQFPDLSDTVDTVKSMSEGDEATATAAVEKLLNSPTVSFLACIGHAMVCRKKDYHHLAIKVLKKAMECATPDDAGTRNFVLPLLADSCCRINDYASSLEYAKQVPDDKLSAHDLNIMGMAQRQLNDQAGAMATFQKAANLDPQNVYALERLAELCIESEDFVAAVQYRQKLTAIEPDNKEFVAGLAHVHASTGNEVDAFKALEAIRDAESFQHERAIVLRVLSDWCHRHADYSSAMLYLKQIPPDCIASSDLNNTGSCLLARGEIQAALEFFEKALALDPSNIPSLMNLADYYYERDDYASALTYISQVPPEHLDSYYWNFLGLCRANTGNEPGAKECFEKAIALDPQNADAPANMAHACFNTQDYAAAIEWGIKALDLDPENYDTAAELAQAHAYLGNEFEARQALKLLPKDPIGLYYRGNVLATLGRFEEAIAPFEKLLAVQPDQDVAQRLVILYEHTGHPKKAKTLKKKYQLDE